MLSTMTPIRVQSRSRTRGVTPVAAALAVLALGASASCMWWLKGLGVESEGQTSSRENAVQIRSAATAFHAQHASGCPTLSSLQQEEFLSRNVRTDDAWGNRFRIR